VQELKKFLGDVARRGNMILSPRGGVASIPKNWMAQLGNEGITLGYDAFSRDKILKQNGRQRVLIEEVVRELRFSFDDKHTVLPPKDAYHETIDRAAWANQFHPVQDYLESLQWDGTKRIDEWLIRYCGAEDSEYVRAIGAITLIAAVRRVYEPGVKFDTMLVLEGIQGSGKSTTVRQLCPDPTWFTDNLPIGAEPQRVIEQTKGKWICEIAELFGLGKREVQQVKAFLSRNVDEARKVYAREPDRRPRQFICIGTTNQLDSYLVDPTGHRRFWPTRVGNAQDVAGITRDRDQLWAEAFERRESSLVLSPELWAVATEEQSKREQDDPWELELEGIFSDPPEQLVPKRGTKQLVVSVQDVYGLLSMPIERQDRITHARLSQVMTKLGFEKGVYRRGSSKPFKGWAKFYSEEELRK
jgi:predicted P-loop ATPase